MTAALYRNGNFAHFVDLGHDVLQSMRFEQWESPGLLAKTWALDAIWREQKPAQLSSPVT
jgi:hypothetical protein